ncbi:salt stress protein, Slr1339 family [Aliterella atlantica]|uniref:Uncharacterized protein n=1 Tax=Aliterella atlantica CENA595 TaxID=1618023 RepID=A0A0D8ZRY6_9CYAN|nr:hypothetical protein [Aliterella atlantica]KJH71495.1 hypothetical protein UH38_11885 [Aliterella atlantica CENA595]
MDSIDKLLAQIKAESQEPTVKPNLPNPAAANDAAIDSLLEQVEGKYQKPPAPQSPNIKRSQPASNSAIDSLLNQVKNDYQEQDKIAAQQKQQQIQAQLQQQQQQRQKQLEALKVQAQAWLEKLDPLSSEGLWFERFAEGYPTKLAAAIEYLQDSH